MVNFDHSSATFSSPNNCVNSVLDTISTNMAEISLKTPWEKYPFFKTVDYVLICFEIFPFDRHLKIFSLQLNQLENRIIQFQYLFQSAKTLMGHRNSIYDQFVPAMGRLFIWNQRKFPDISYKWTKMKNWLFFQTTFKLGVIRKRIKTFSLPIKLYLTI